MVEQEIWCLVGGQITGHQENMWLGSLKSAWVPDRWTLRKFSRKLGWWDRRLKPYPGVVCNGLLDFLDVVVAKWWPSGGQVKCAHYTVPTLIHVGQCTIDDDDIVH